MLVSKITEEDLTTEVIDRLLFQGLEDTGDNSFSKINGREVVNPKILSV